MDLIVLLSIAIAILVVIVSILFFLKSKKTDPVPSNAPEEPARNRQAVARRGQLGRNLRDRQQRSTGGQQPQQQQQQRQEEDSENEDENDDLERPAVDFKADEKMGAKKRAKLEAKAEKKVQRENEQRLREEKKKKDAELEEERKKVEEKELEEEKRKEEIERLAKEEKERKEHEEYLKLKATFEVEEEGFEEEPESENLLQDFVNFIKNNKVVVLEDLATHFKLKTQSVIDRINELKSNGTLTGVVDDRGKFIYISEIELHSVAKFIKQRGRVSISDLAESSNSLINLVPVKVEH